MLVSAGGKGAGEATRVSTHMDTFTLLSSPLEFGGPASWGLLEGSRIVTLLYVGWRFQWYWIRCVYFKKKKMFSLFTILCWLLPYNKVSQKQKNKFHRHVYFCSHLATVFPTRWDLCVETVHEFSMWTQTLNHRQTRESHPLGPHLPLKLPYACLEDPWWAHLNSPDCFYLALEVFLLLALCLWQLMFVVGQPVKLPSGKDLVSWGARLGRLLVGWGENVDCFYFPARE